MDTLIKFAGGDGDSSVAMRVKEDVEAVMGALTAAQGMPSPLTHFKSDERVYINPSTIAFWRPIGPSTGQFM